MKAAKHRLKRYSSISKRQSIKNYSATKHFSGCSITKSWAQQWSYVLSYSASRIGCFFYYAYKQKILKQNIAAERLLGLCDSL